MVKVSAGKRNLFGRIARSRMARDAMGAGRIVALVWLLAAFWVGTWVIVESGLRLIFGR